MLDTSAPTLQQQEEMKEVSSTSTLSARGQCSDPRKLAPVLALCVRVYCPAAPLPQTVDKMVRIFFLSKPSKQAFFFPFCVCRSVKRFGAAEVKLSSPTEALVDLQYVYFLPSKLLITL